MKRTLLLVTALVGISASWASPANASLTTNELDCRASARITTPEGDVFDLDADRAEATLPRRGTAAWQGSLGTVTSAHRGRVVLNLGPSEVELGSWGPSPNPARVSSASGTTELPAVLDDVPPGTYVLSGYHQGAEGRCEGTIDVAIGQEESVVNSRAGRIGAVGTALFAGLLAYAARPRARRSVLS